MATHIYHHPAIRGWDFNPEINHPASLGYPYDHGKPHDAVRSQHDPDGIHLCRPTIHIPLISISHYTT